MPVFFAGLAWKGISTTSSDVVLPELFVETEFGDNCATLTV